MPALLRPFFREEGEMTNDTAMITLVGTVGGFEEFIKGLDTACENVATTYQVSLAPSGLVTIPSHVAKEENVQYGFIITELVNMQCLIHQASNNLRLIFRCSYAALLDIREAIQHALENGSAMMGKYDDCPGYRLELVVVTPEEMEHLYGRSRLENTASFRPPAYFERLSRMNTPIVHREADVAVNGLLTKLGIEVKDGTD